MSRALILMYHSIDAPLAPAEARYCVRPDVFREQMSWLAASGRTLVGLPELVDALRTGRPMPAESVAVTFDDGFECFMRNALPVLDALHIPSTMFAVAGKLGGGNDWMQIKGWPARPLMSAAQLREISRSGVTVGCHALTHVPMTQTDEIQLRAETTTAREMLTQALGHDVSLFAYPHGAQGARERAAVAAAGFAAACSTASGFNRADADLFALRRIDVYGSDGVKEFRRKVQFGANRVTHADLARYYAQRIYARFHG